MNKVTIEEFLKLFSEEVHNLILQNFARVDVNGLVCFENQTLDSSSLGRRTAMIVGPGCTYKSHEDCIGKHLYDLPSQRQYPTVYVEK